MAKTHTAVAQLPGVS